MIESYLDDQSLARGQSRSLARKLDGALRKLRGAKPDRAIRLLQKFDDKVDRLVRRGALLQGAASPLLTRSGIVQQDIALLRESLPAPPPDPDLYCEPAPPECPAKACVYTTYHVRPPRGGLAISPDGSEARPFPTIARALERAAEIDLCGVAIELARGDYLEDVALSRDTRIRGESLLNTTINGSVESGGAYELVLERLRVTGGISVDHPCATPTLSGVSIRGARGFGVLQRGGALEVHNSVVLRTLAQPERLTRGTGIFLACGIQAVLDGVEISESDASGLQVVGNGTSLVATRLTVTKTAAHPTVVGLVSRPDCVLPKGAGAVQVRDGARMTVSIFTMDDNALISLLVGWDATATLQHVTIAHTRQLEGRCGAGHGAMAVHGGAIELRNFAVLHSDLAGVHVAEGSEMDLHQGLIAHNDVGASVVDADFNIARLRDRVEYLDNERTLSATAYPVPEAVGGIDE
jgi:hypothetical protein